MNEKYLTDALLKSYSCELENGYDIPDYKPSFWHRIRMRKILNLSKAKPTKTKQASTFTVKHFSPKLIFIAIILAAVFVLSASVYVFTSTNFSGYTNRYHTNLSFISDLENCPKTLEKIYFLQYLPDDYICKEQYYKNTLNSTYFKYQNTVSDNLIVFEQTVKTKYKNLDFNTEKYTLKETTVNGCPGILSSSEIDGYNWYHLIWDNGDYILELSFSYHPSDSELQKIVENIAIKQAI